MQTPIFEGGVEDYAPLVDGVVTRFGVAPSDVSVVRAPYRICPLGAHIDHQFGPVAACAVDHAVYLAFAPSDARIHLASTAFDGEVQVDLDAISDPRPSDWGNYARGAVAALGSAYRLERGFVGMTSGQRSEAGLSSSAAIGIAYLLALEHVNDIAVQPVDNVRFDEHIETRYLNLQNGILDPAAILYSRAAHLTEIDTRSAEYRVHPAGNDAFRLLAFHSGVREALSPDNFNGRVEECRAAASALARTEGDWRLGDIDVSRYAAGLSSLPPALARRAEHFFSERERVNASIPLWRAGDWPGLGKLMTQSGWSSINNYECGSPPLIALYEILNDAPGVFGARFSGAGFRGCCIALVDPARSEDIVDYATRKFAERYCVDDCWALVCRPADGARVL